VERPSVPIIVCGDFNESPDEYIRVDRCYPTAIMCSGVGVPAMAIEGEPLWAYGSLDSIQDADSILGADIPSADSVQDAGLYERIELYTPWAEHPDKFSLAYREKREQYDGFLLNRSLKDGIGLEYQDFYVADAPMLFTAEGVPREWRGTDGYSDHLPVELVLSVVEGVR
ncbi:MAG TPA: hypothetical protein PK712_00380, partial [Rectinema sp.]|nr:hypothetical protein [Rectinema sp.]